LITRRIPDEALALLRPHCSIDQHNFPTAIPRGILLKKIAKAEGLLCILTEKIDQELLSRAPKLRCVSTYSVGFDHIDVPACSKRGIVVTNTPGVLTETTADFTWALLMAAARRVVEGDGFMRAGKYKAWDPMLLLGTDVFGKTLGIVGFGRIGQAVARRARGFGMNILYSDSRRLPLDKESQFGARYASLEDLLHQSDFVSLHCTLDRETYHLIDKKALSLMKPSATLINAARGPIVEEAALVSALKAGKIRGAALDVYEKEPRMSPGLSKLKNVVLAPHLASASLETRTKMGMMAAQGLLDVLVFNRRPGYLVNPEVLEKTHG
jgi:glyoxylate reductase